ncbi:hypothetical protein J2T17_005009 [Paenibacillus mucilaginosus]|uniref:hypothetical protein n=1 Tax=Paenibacillus mucilaginosus TaxID=61624 RepID=UPI003D1BC27B
MKNLKKLSAALAVATIVSSVAVGTGAYAQTPDKEVPAAEQSKKKEFSGQGVSAPIKLTEAELQKARAEAVPAIGVIRPVGQEKASTNFAQQGIAATEYQIPAENISFTFNNLEDGEAIVSDKMIHTFATGTIPVTVVQWDDSSWYTTKVSYQLVSTSGEDIGYTAQTVTGDYTSNNFTLNFVNVPAGWYKIKITNVGWSNVSGNGYTSAK